MLGVAIVLGAAVFLPLAVRGLLEVAQRIQQSTEDSKHGSPHPAHAAKN